MPNLHLQKNSTTPSSTHPVDWLQGKLDWGRDLRNWIPTRFERYARILHPAYIVIGKEWETREVPVPWTSVSKWSGKTLHATTHIQDLMVRSDGHDWRKQGEGGREPNQGVIPNAPLSCLLAHLANGATTPTEIWMLIWSGYGGAEDTCGLPVEVSKQLTASGRQYFLHGGSIDSSPRDYRDAIFEHPPSFWWPADQSWFVATDIDASSTYVGGSKELINQILNDPCLEAFPAELDDPYGGLYVERTALESKTDYVLPQFHLWPFRHHLFFRFRRRPSSSVYLFRKKRWWERIFGMKS